MYARRIVWHTPHATVEQSYSKSYEMPPTFVDVRGVLAADDGVEHDVRVVAVRVELGTQLVTGLGYNSLILPSHWAGGLLVDQLP